jgi:putative membrane protein
MNYIYALPHVNATLNSISALLLIAGFILIRRRNITAHRKCMIAAFVTSLIFLVSYITYHSLLVYYLGQGPTRFRGEGWVRPVYFTILLTHTVLAVIIAPLAIITLWRGLSERFDKHRRIARWTLPVWLYVSVTGVMVYLMLYQFYPAR